MVVTAAIDDEDFEVMRIRDRNLKKKNSLARSFVLCYCACEEFVVFYAM